ncbi:MAG: L-threonylcarbamoyladenylate synthase [Candidatus Omnitrophota bacterium]
MKTLFLNVNAKAPEKDKIKKIVNCLHRGGVVAFPTETVYGLAVDSTNKTALNRLYDIKQRDEEKPCAIQISDISYLNSYIEAIPVKLSEILNKFWPGPLTIILNSKEGKVGLRIPDNRVALAILAEASAPLVVTSANVSGEREAKSAKDVLDIFDGKIDIVIDDGQLCAGTSSTVLDCTVTPYKIIRAGMASQEISKMLSQQSV